MSDSYSILLNDVNYLYHYLDVSSKLSSIVGLMISNREFNTESNHFDYDFFESTNIKRV